MGLFVVERRLVVVEQVERWKAPDVKAVQEYLRKPAPTSVLALVGAEVKRDSPLAKTVAKAGEVLVFDLPTRGRKVDLPKWVEQQFHDRGIVIDHDAARALVELAGDNTDELATEVDKLSTWAAGERIGERAVAELVPARADAPPFDLTDAWGRRDVAGEVQLVRRRELPSVRGVSFRLGRELGGALQERRRAGVVAERGRLARRPVERRGR